MTDKEKLAALIRKAKLSMWGKSFGSDLARIYYIAEYLMKNGVVIPVRCTDCKYAADIEEPFIKNRFIEGTKSCRMCRGDNGYGYHGVSIIRPDDFCNDGERKEE